MPRLGKSKLAASLLGDLSVRITLLINRDLASNVALNLLLPQLVERHQLTAFYSDRVGTQPDAPSLAMLFFFEHTLLDQLLFPPIDDLSHRGNRLTFRALSTFLTAPMQRLNDPNSPSGIALLKSANPDLIVSIRYGRILKQSAIDIPHLGVLNLHSGKLPQYRGVMATFRALLAGDAELFSTLHWIDDETIDTGRIISIQGVPTDPDGCYLSNTLNLYPSGCRALLGAINTLDTQESPEAVAPGNPGHYFTFPDRDALARFHRAGNRLVDPALLAPILSSYYPH